ncbi:MAG: hypothetical protein WBN92_18965 [Terriglobia bacterium]
MADHLETMTLAYLDILVANQQRAARWYAALATGTAVLGLIVLIAGLLWGARLAGESLRAILGIAGGFISTGSAFPLKEVLNCHERLSIYRALRGTFIGAEPEDVERIHDLVWGAIGKIAGS